MRAIRSYPWVALALLAACGRGSSTRFTPPTFPDGGLLRDASPMPKTGLGSLDGTYSVEGASGRVGRRVVVKSDGALTSVFGSENASYVVLSSGCRDGGKSAVMEGYFRYATETEAGLVRLRVEPPDAAAALCRGETTDEPITLRGEMGGDEALGETLVLRREAPLRDRNGRFLVVAHRGGCRTSDDCGASENSVAVIRLARRFGADVIEVDVRMTRDGVPVLYHDDVLTPRLTKGTYCHGPIGDFTLAHLRALCTLTGGEPIPTLDEALTTVLTETTLEGVWLDVKEPSAIAPSAIAAERFRVDALALGRTARVVLGLGTDELVSAYRASPPPGSPSCLAETSHADATALGCRVWAPRWTLGPMHDEVQAAQASGLRVAFWTLDEPEFIDAFLRDATPNGILTDRPMLVVNRFELVGTAPTLPSTP
jgi:glycerophosphoryl diester phosphodiesterase